MNCIRAFLLPLVYKFKHIYNQVPQIQLDNYPTFVKATNKANRWNAFINKLDIKHSLIKISQ